LILRRTGRSTLQGTDPRMRDIRTEFAADRTARKNLPIIGSVKFGMMNFASITVKQLDMLKTARILEGNGLKDHLLPPGYQSFPEVAMLRYDQERGEQLSKERIRIPKPGYIRQVAPVQTGPVIVKKVMTINVPSWELAGLKAVQEETERRELARLKAD